MRIAHPRFQRRSLGKCSQRQSHHLLFVFSKVSTVVHTFCESPNEPNAIRPGLRILLFHSSFCSNSDELLSALVSSNLMFNIPLALMMLAALIILTFWIEIHARCAELTRQSGVATVSRRTFASSCAEALLSKTGMCAPSSLTF